MHSTATARMLIRHFMIWIPLALTSLFFLWQFVALAFKGDKMNRQMARFRGLQADFEARRPLYVQPKNAGLPHLLDALTKRKNFLDGRSKKRAEKQRRLVNRLKLKERE